MRFKQPRRRDPFRELISAIRVAARQIEIPAARRIAARQADQIPLTFVERAHGGRAKMAKLARQQMRSLSRLAPEDYADVAAILFGCADALDSHFEITSEIHLGRKGPGSNAAA
jgi:hypothetical protein